MGTGRRSARWFAAVLGIALVASAVVVYLLIRVTAPSADPDEGLAAVSSDVSDLTAASSDAADAATSDPQDTTASESTTGTSGGISAAPTTGATSGSMEGVTTGPDTTNGPTSRASTPADPSVLPGSAVPLPAAWSGTAQVDITVTGDCPGAKPTHYTTPADIALDVAGGGAAVTETGSTSSTAPGEEPTLTIGVNTAAVPTVAVYSATVDNTGAFHRFWSLSVARSGTGTEVLGTVVSDDGLAGNNPNLLVDAVQPPADCATVPVNGLPRVLAVGSTLTGWLDVNTAKFTLHAVTTDGQRSLTVTIAATRSH
jgi:hypothetical protein